MFYTYKLYEANVVEVFFRQILKNIKEIKNRADLETFLEKEINTLFDTLIKHIKEQKTKEDTVKAYLKGLNKIENTLGNIIPEIIQKSMAELKKLNEGILDTVFKGIMNLFGKKTQQQQIETLKNKLKKLEDEIKEKEYGELGNTLVSQLKKHQQIILNTIKKLSDEEIKNIVNRLQKIDNKGAEQIITKIENDTKKSDDEILGSSDIFESLKNRYKNTQNNNFITYKNFF